jgi:hypothetical protein
MQMKLCTQLENEHGHKMDSVLHLSSVVSQQGETPDDDSEEDIHACSE